MQNVLLIGGAGYIGSHIVFKLCDLGYNVKVLDDLSSGFKENVDTRAKFIHGSIFDDVILNPSHCKCRFGYTFSSAERCR